MIEREKMVKAVRQIEMMRVVRDTYEECADYLIRFLASELNLPPCKIGDKIYVIPSRSNWRINNMYESMKPLNRIYEQTVDEIHIYQSGYTVSSCEGVQHQPSVLFGETWFLTREEAEKALKGRESNV